MSSLITKRHQYLLIFLALLTICTPLYSQEPTTTDTELSRVVVAEPSGIPEQVLILYNKFTKQTGNSSSGGKGNLSKAQLDTTVKLMKTLYVTAAESGDAHGTVALLIKQGLAEESLSQDFKNSEYEHTKISEGSSLQMAQAREQMIEGTMLEVLSSRKDISVGRSDTGNPNSGMRSDLDQTFFVFRVDKETGAKTRAPDLDQSFMDDFNKQWTKNYGELSLKMLDVVSLKGSARFPDPRYVSFETFADSYNSAAAELRNQEGAYISPDAITQQVHKRQYETLMTLQGKTKIDPDNPPRVWQEYGTADGGEAGKISSPDYELAVREMIGGTPELTPQAAFSAAIANWMMLQHSFNGDEFNVKYHLRTFDDGIYIDILRDQGGGMKNKAEYSKMTPEQRSLIAEEAMARLFPDDVKKQKYHKAAMDVSAELRNAHTKSGGGQPEPSSPALAGADDQKIYEPLLQELYGEKYTPGDDSPLGKIRLESQIDAAKSYHRKLASEFCIKTAQTTAPAAFEAMKGGTICDEVRPFFETEGRNWDETRGNIVEGAKLTLMWGIHDLGMAEGYNLMKSLGAADTKATSWDLAKLYMDSQFMPIRAYKANYESYNRALGARFTVLADDVRNYALDQWGFEKVGEFEAVGTILKSQKHIFSWRKLAKNMFYDMGSVASMGQIAETYVLSKGDLEKVARKALDELLLAVPVVGQLENLRRGGIEGAAIMGFVLYFPPAGKVLVAYNIAKSVYIIADAEYYSPRRNNAADAVYRGFAGPSTRAYGEPGDPPPFWNDALDKEYADKKKRYSDTKTLVYVMETKPFHPDMPKEFVDNFIKNLPQAKRELKIAKKEFEQIERVKVTWEKFRDGNWSGGYLTGGGEVLNQIWFEKPLLDTGKVEPVIAFLSGGVVDLRVDFKPERDDPKILQCTIDAKKGETIEEQIRARGELLRLNLLKGRYEKAQRYLERMKTNKELRVRFLRDSVYANIQEKKINMDSFAVNYFKKNDARMYHALLAKDLISPVSPSNVGRIGHEPFPMASDYTYIVPPSVKEIVRERLQQDYERSRRLLAMYKANENNRKAEHKKQIEKAIIDFQNQGFAVAKNHYNEDKNFLKFLEILRFSSVKRKAPRVRMTFYKTLSNSEEVRKGKKGEPLIEPHQLDLQVNVQLDPSLYPPGYKTLLVELTPDQAANPSESINGIKLLPTTISRIKELSQKHKQEIDKGEIIIAVGSVSCKEVASMDGVLPETLKGLPGYENGKAVSGEVILGQQADAIPTKPFTVAVDPVRVKVIDAAGNPIAGVKEMVTIGESKIATTAGGYWGAHTFTKYDEELQIQANYKFSEDKVISGSAVLSINDIKNWLEPSMGEEDVVIQLPILMPESVRVKGNINVNKVANTISLSKTASLQSGSLGVNIFVGVPGTKGGGDGSFEIQSKRPMLPNEAIKITGATSGTVRVKLSPKKTVERNVQYNGMKSIPVPATGGTVDAGTLNLVGNFKLVEVPSFDTATPTLYRNYMGKVSSAGLIPKPEIIGLPDDPKFSHCVIKTVPRPGSMVPPGSDVSVEIYSGSDMTVPDVVNLHIKDATEILKKKKIKAKPEITVPPPTPNKEYHVITQSQKSGTPFSPGLELKLEIYGRAADMSIKVPDLMDQTLTLASKTIQDAGLRLKKDPSSIPAPDLRHEGLIYKQKPAKGKPATANQEVTAWVYGKEEGGGDANAIGDITGPFYVVFGLAIPLPDEKYGKIIFPKKRENESDGAFNNRVRSFINGIPLSRLRIMEMPSEQCVLPFHVSGAATARYPRSMFLPGAKITAKCEIVKFDPKPNQPARFAGALLFKVFGVFDTMEEVINNYPKAESKNDLSGLAFTSANGICKSETKNERFVIGPLSVGWTQNDISDSWNFWKEIFISLGKLSCFVGTVSYPDTDDPYFVALRQFRDQVLLHSVSGRRLVELYYRRGPDLAAFVLNHNLQEPTRRTLDMIGKRVQSLEDADLLTKLKWRIVIETAGMALPMLEPIIFNEFNEHKEKSIWNSNLPASFATNLLEGNN